jgi:hypothetical protein
MLLAQAGKRFFHRTLITHVKVDRHSAGNIARRFFCRITADVHYNDCRAFFTEPGRSLPPNSGPAARHNHYLVSKFHALPLCSGPLAVAVGDQSIF